MTYIGIDQYGQHFPLFTDHPRKELMEHLGRKSARKMYCDLRDGGYAHIGYVIAGLWIRVFGVEGRTFRKEMK